jgi:hypothetical protein
LFISTEILAITRTQDNQPIFFNNPSLAAQNRTSSKNHMSDIMSIVSSKILASAMSHPKLSTIGTATSKPTFTMIRAALKQSMVNAMSHYYIDSHTYGFMGTLMSECDADYLALPGITSAFIIPTHPEGDSTIAPVATAAAISEACYCHECNLSLFDTYTNMLNLLKVHPLAAIHPMYLSTSVHWNLPPIGFASVTITQMYSYLTTIYSTLNYAYHIVNKTRMKAIWRMPPTPFEELIQQIEDGRTITTSAGITMDDMSLVDIGYTIINNTGQFMDNCKLWRKAEATDTQTWTIFKTFFQNCHLQQ